MTTIKHNVSLKPYNTFGIDVKATYFCEVTTENELLDILTNKNYPEKIFIGGGSNMLLTKNINKLVVHLNIKGKEVINETSEQVYVKASAGENWHELVVWAIDNNYGGIENLSLIPGNAGTAPMQNIGAYGVELKDVFFSCEAIHLKTLNKKVFSLEECQFGYRESIFKTSLKNQYIITSITLCLTKSNHVLKTSYGAINEELETRNIKIPTIKDVSNAVIAIRKSKLPDPAQLGNSGSFFKNPIISTKQFEVFINTFKDDPFYKTTDSEIKIPAGWLIEQCGFKGKRFGDAGVHEKQALVLVNYGSATGKEILSLAKRIQKAVKKKFNIAIDAEVNIM